MPPHIVVHYVNSHIDIVLWLTTKSSFLSGLVTSTRPGWALFMGYSCEMIEETVDDPEFALSLRSSDQTIAEMIKEVV